MAESTKLTNFFQKINPKILKEWKRTINRTELIRERLEEALEDNIKKHQEER